MNSRSRRAERARLEPLKRAVAALDAGDDGGALQALCDAWRARRSPAIVEMIERLDAQQADRPFAGLVEASAGETIARLRAVEEDDDPRLATAILGLLTEPRFFDEAELWDLAMMIAGRLADPRLLPIAEGVHHSLYLKLGPPALRDRICRRLDEAVRRTSEPRRARADEAALEAAIASRLDRSPVAQEHERELLDQIYRDPMADGPRLVYADLLVARGDPRGELIVLQFHRRDAGPTPEAWHREQALLHEHIRMWLGGLAPVVSHKRGSSTTFERGFVAVAEVYNHRDHGALRAREWATVEEIRGLTPEILRNAPLRALRRTRGPLALATLAIFAQRPECFEHLDWLEVELSSAPSAHERELLLACEGLPALHHLGLSGPAITPALMAELLSRTDVARRLQRLVIWGLDPAGFDGFLDALRGIDGRVPAVEIHVPRGTLSRFPFSPLEYVRAPGGGYVPAPDRAP